MTRVHFQAIAAALAEEKTAVTVREQTRAAIARNLAKQFARFNPKFNANKFLAACKVEG